MVLLPQDAPILACISYLDPEEFGDMQHMQLWYVLSMCRGRDFVTRFCPRHDLEPAGDGVRSGSIVKNHHTLATYGFETTYEFECQDWTWSIGGVQKQRETTQYLSRLDVLKELFNVFINRAVGSCSVFLLWL